MTNEQPIKFVDVLPPRRKGAGTGRRAAYLDELRRNPGRWAVVAKYPLTRGSAARSRGSSLTKRHPDIEVTSRREGDEIVLYMRAIEGQP